MQKVLYLAGGCFWGLQHYFDQVAGVLSTEVGYANGNIENPSYEQVCTGLTNAAETVEVVYDDDQIGLEDILNLFFHAIDPTQVNRQGNDRGTQYRSGIYAGSQADLDRVEQYVDALRKRSPRPIATEVMLLESFAPAETYHQKYLVKNPGGYCHIGREEFDYARNYKVAKAG